MLSSLRIADVLLLLLISQTTQAGPVRRAERLFGRDWNSTASAVTSLHSTSSIAPDPTDLSTSANPVTAQKEEDGPTPSPIFTTLDDRPGSSPAATQPVGQSPSTTAAQSTTESPSMTGTEPVFFTPPLSTISIPTTTSAAGQDGMTTSGAATSPPVFSSISLPPFPTTNTRNTTSVPADGERGASPGQTMQSSLSFAFPIPGQTTAASTTPADQPAASSTTAPELSTTAASLQASSTCASTTSALTAQPSPDASASPSSSTPPSFQTTPPSSATLKVTGTPIPSVPTIMTSNPAATATVSPEVADRNLENANTFNKIFDTLTEQSACRAGQFACVKGNRATCGPDGSFEIEICETGTSCFALPMNTTEGVIVMCYDPALARSILGEPMPAPAPGSSTSAPAQAPPASGVVSEIRTTVTPTSVVVSTVSVKVPEVTSPAAPIATVTSTVLVEAPEPTSTSAPGVITTVFVTRTIDRDSSTATENEPTTTAGDEETTTLITSTRRRTSSSTSTPESTTPAATTTPATTTITDTLTFAPIPSTVPSVLVEAKATDAPAPDVVTVKVTVTEKETVTVTTTAKNIETLILTITKTQ